MGNTRKKFFGRLNWSGASAFGNYGDVGSGSVVDLLGEEKEMSRIVRDNRILGGVAVVRGSRVPVSSLVELVVRRGKTVKEVVTRYYPQLTEPEVREAIEEYLLCEKERVKEVMGDE